MRRPGSGRGDDRRAAELDRRSGAHDLHVEAHRRRVLRDRADRDPRHAGAERLRRSASGRPWAATRCGRGRRSSTSSSGRRAAPQTVGAIRRLRLFKAVTIEEEFYRWDVGRRATFRVTAAVAADVRRAGGGLLAGAERGRWDALDVDDGDGAAGAAGRSEVPDPGAGARATRWPSGGSGRSCRSAGTGLPDGLVGKDPRRAGSCAVWGTLCVGIQGCCCAAGRVGVRAGGRDGSRPSGDVPGRRVPGCSYSPPNTEAAVGDTVTFSGAFASHPLVWTNNDFPDAVQRRRRNTYTFTRAGTFAFHCQIHASMVGSVHVAGNAFATPDFSWGAGEPEDRAGRDVHAGRVHRSGRHGRALRVGSRRRRRLRDHRRGAVEDLHLGGRPTTSGCATSMTATRPRPRRPTR